MKAKVKKKNEERVGEVQGERRASYGQKGRRGAVRILFLAADDTRGHTAVIP